MSYDMWQRKFRIAVGIALTFGGIVVMAGWLAQWPVWSLIFPSSTAIVFNTAFCFVLCGVLLLPIPAVAGRRRTGIALAAAVIVIALVQCLENLFALETGLDWAALHRWFADANPHPGRMAPNTALSFLGAGIYLLFVQVQRDQKPAFTALPVLIMAMGILGFVAYSPLFDLTYEVMKVARMSFPVSIGFFLLGAALLAERHARNLTDSEPRTFAEERIYGFLGLAIAIQMTLAAVSFGSINALIERTRWVEHTGQVRAAFEKAVSLSDRARAAWRDRIDSGNPADAERFRAAAAQAGNQFGKVERLIIDNPDQTSLLRELRRRVGDDLTRMDMALRSNAAAEQLQPLRHAREQQEELVRRFRDEEERLQSRRKSQSRDGAEVTTEIIVAGNLLGLAVLVGAIWQILRQTAARTRLERALSETNRELADLYDHAPCGYHSIDSRGMVVGMNQTELNWLGYTADEVIGKIHYSQIYSSASRSKAAAVFGEFMRDGFLHDVEYDYVRKDGSILPVSINTVAIRDAAGKYRMSRSTSFDISRRRQAENELQRANAFLDSLIEHIPLPIVVKDVEELRYLRVNLAWETLLGYSRAGIVGKRACDLVPPEEADASVARDRAALARQKPSMIAVETIRTLHQGNRILLTMKVPILSEDGCPIYLLSIGQDITERRQAEQEIEALNSSLLKSAEQLQIANRELEGFAYSVSHDLRAPLRAVDGYAQMLEEDCLEQLDEEGRRFVAQIRMNSRRMGGLIDDLLRFSRLSRQPLNKTRIDMNKLVGDVLSEELRDMDGTAPEIELDPLPEADGDPALLRQVWTNLVSNAIKYSSKASAPHIRIAGTPAEDEIRYDITDNGAGFDMAYYDKLFGVFQRLHRTDEFEGTGVGLAIVHRVISRHGGRVWAEGRVNQGASFHFAIPSGG